MRCQARDRRPIPTAAALSQHRREAHGKPSIAQHRRRQPGTAGIRVTRTAATTRATETPDTVAGAAVKSAERDAAHEDRDAIAARPPATEISTPTSTRHPTRPSTRPTQASRRRPASRREIDGTGTRRPTTRPDHTDHGHALACRHPGWRRWRRWRRGCHRGAVRPFRNCRPDAAAAEELPPAAEPSAIAADTWRRRSGRGTSVRADHAAGHRGAATGLGGGGGGSPGAPALPVAPAV